MTAARWVLLYLAGALVLVAAMAAARGSDHGSTSAVTAVAEPTVTARPTEPSGPTDQASPTPTAPPISTGTFAYAPSTGETFGKAPFRAYAVGVETGVGIDPAELAAFVDSTLADPKSWIGDNTTGFARVDQPGEQVQFTLVVATPATVDELCAPLDTQGIYSCGNNGWIALNLTRWRSATEGWPADLETYQRYLVNHEVGHYILGPVHDECTAVGDPAPIMMQQSVALAGCTPNGWVYPEASG